MSHCTGITYESRGSNNSIRSRTKRGPFRVRSGFLDKPRLSVLVKQRCPHMNQDMRYVTEPLTFNQLNFSQFVGSECRTILRTCDQQEREGRLQVLSKTAYLYNQCGNWGRAMATYFAIVGSIEEGEATWSSSFGHYDLMCPPAVREGRSENREETGWGAHNSETEGGPRRDFFCKDFGRNECTQQAPHRAWIVNKFQIQDGGTLLCTVLEGQVGQAEPCTRKWGAVCEKMTRGAR